MSNSPLVSHVHISPNRTSPRTHAIDTVTVHCMAGNLSVEACGNGFASPARKASSNYGIGSDGRIGMYVEEKDRSWCSSSAANDHRAVTIEVANDGGAETGWHVSDAAYRSLVLLLADICRRNGIPELRWRGDRSLIGQVGKQNMTVHRWFARKACPGDYLYGLHGQIAEDVNSELSGGKRKKPGPEQKKPAGARHYTVQAGSYSDRKNAEAQRARLEKAGFHASVAKKGAVFKVQAGVFSDRGRAERQRDRIVRAGFRCIIT